MNCSKTLNHTEFGSQFKYKSSCEKPVYKEGLCKRHFDKKQLKMLNWGERSTYRSAIQEDLDLGKSLKLRHINRNEIYKCQNNKMMKFDKKTNRFIECDLEPDLNNFVVKI